MIKSELIRLIAAKMTHLPEKNVAEAIDRILLLMSDALIAGQHIEIRGFGSFVTYTAKPRSARNPKTGERVLASAKSKIHFRPGLLLKKRLMVSQTLIAIEATKEKNATEEAQDE